MALLRALVTLLFAFAVTPFSEALTFGFPYGSQKVRGVNLGGWLVLEPWITPSLFDDTGDSRIIDEWTFGQYQNKEVAKGTLKNHWDTWITEDDFAQIAHAGLNHVRLPIGYWAFDVSAGEPYIQGQLEYLDNAVLWAQRYQLKLIVDLHGAPGSQNGFDNSGQKKSEPEWQKDPKNIERSSAIIKTLAARYKDTTGVVPIIAPLNEPAGFKGDDILEAAKQYWLDSYDNIRFPSKPSQQQSNLIVMIHDTFKPLGYWNGFMDYPKYDGVILDTHIYQIFSTDENKRTSDEHIESACNTRSALASSSIWVVVGEWTPAATDCAKYLNGRGIGSRYDGSFPGSTRVGSCAGLTGKASTFSSSYKTFLRKFWEAQAMSYERGGQGWIQWTWKTEIADEWSYQAGLQHGWIPSKPTDYQFGNICG